MIKNYFLKSILALLLGTASLSLIAQPTIPADSANYEIGVDTKVNVISNASSFSTGGSGASQVWDFSGLAAGTERNMTVEAIVTGGLNPDPVSAAVKLVIEGAIIDDVYYYDPSSSGLGYAGISWGVNVLNYAGEGAQQWEYPITYQSTQTYNVAKTYTTGFGPTAVDHKIAGTVSYEVDAYGRVKMPYGDVYDVMRIKISEMVTDTADVPIVGEQVFNYDNVMYEWRTISNRHFILRYDRKSESSTTTRTLYYQVGDSVNSGTQPSSVEMLMPKLPEFMVSPNPAQDMVSVSVELKNAESLYNLRLMDLNGRTVKEFGIHNEGQKTFLETFDLSDIPAGNYILNLNTDQRNLHKRIVVQ